MGRGLRCAVSLGLLAAIVGGGMAAPAAVVAKQKIRVWLEPQYCWKTIRDRFVKENPGTDVELIGGSLDKFYTSITAGLMPDAWGIWGTAGITADVNRNWALDLGPYMQRDAVSMGLSDFFPGVMRQFRVRGKQYSLPVFSYTDCYFYNTDMYAKAGLQPPPLDASDKSWNWDRMLENAMKMTKRSADGNRVQEPGMEFSRDFACTPDWIRMWGVKLYSDDALKTSIPQEIYLNTPEMHNAITKMWELIYRNKVATPAATGFAAGKTGSSIEHGWNVFNIMHVKKLKWAIAPLPWALSDAGTLWPDGWRISRLSKNKELAWKFVKYLSSPESMKLLATDPKSERWGSAVARRSVFAGTLGAQIGEVTGMKAEDVYRVNEQADAVGVVKEYETICVHADLSYQYLEPVFNLIWANKIGPDQACARLDEAAHRGLPTLFKRWIRNVQYSGVQL